MIELGPCIRLMELFAFHLDHIYCRLTKTVCSHRSSRVGFVHCKQNSESIKISVKFEWFEFFENLKDVWKSKMSTKWQRKLTETLMLMQNFHHLLSKTRTEILHHFGSSCRVWQRNLLVQLYRECLFALLRHLKPPTIEKTIY